MEPLDDQELSALLRKWEAPAAPASLSAKVLPQQASGARHWWQWIITGSVRIPVPVGLAVLLAMAALLYFGTQRRPVAVQPARSVSLSDFQPVKQLEPRVIGRANEN